MPTKCNCIEDLTGMVITGVLSIIGVLLYGGIIGAFYFREYDDLALATIYTLFASEGLTVLF